MFRKILIGLGLFVIGLIATGFIALNAFPGKILTFMQSSAASSADLVEKSIVVDGYEMSYFESKSVVGDARPTLILLHGMGDDKNSFVQTAGELNDDYHIILPELMGHGVNARDPNRDYSIAGHVAFLEKAFIEMGQEEFALGGNSMGGHISAAYTLGHPTQVKDLILINAPGLKLDDNVVYGGFGAKMENREDYYAVMDRVVHNRPSIPGPIVDYMIEDININFDFLNRLAEAVKSGSMYDLRTELGAIKAPTLILWGQEDQVVRFNVAEGYKERISNSNLVVIEEAGHSPQLEKPTEVAMAIKSFLMKSE